jgi:hypothetical protein
MCTVHDHRLGWTASRRAAGAIEGPADSRKLQHEPAGSRGGLAPDRGARLKSEQQKGPLGVPGPSLAPCVKE